LCFSCVGDKNSSNAPRMMCLPQKEE